MVAYAACPGTSSDGGGACQKKVIEVGPSLFRCEKCQRTYDTCNYRYVLSLHVADHTGQNWVVFYFCFNYRMLLTMLVN